MNEGTVSLQTLRRIAERGGIAAEGIREISIPATGRIHTVALVRTDRQLWVLQRVNRQVIADAAALVDLTRLALHCFDMPPLQYSWPAHGATVLEYAGESWICRTGIEGTTPCFPPDRDTLLLQGAALRRLHERFP